MAECENTTTMITYEEDRLSSLPDTLLLEILSLLPFASAAATSALSRRWVSLWTQLPHIIIDYNFRYYDDIEKFLTAVDHILNQMTSPKIKTFELDFHPYNSEIEEFNVWFTAFNSWISLICARNPVHFKVSFISKRGQLFPLPPCIFETKSLEEIDLLGNFYWKLTECGNLNLPNLKKLSLYCVQFDSKVLRTLFKSFPLLETLFLRLEFEKDEVVEISAPILKSLNIWIRGSSLGSKFVIDTPLLEKFGVVEDYIASYCFVNHPRNLGRARIHFHNNILMQGSIYITKIHDLVRGVSSTRFLQLDNNVALFKMVPDVWSLFRNLTHLRLCVSEEHLNWGAAIPLCLLCKLNEIELSGIKGDENDISSVQFILHNANVLKWLHIRRYHSSGNRGKSMLWKEYKFCGHLFMLSKSSLSCEIEFKGEYIHASSYGSQVQGTSQINWRSPHMFWPYIVGDDEE